MGDDITAVGGFAHTIRAIDRLDSDAGRQSWLTVLRPTCWFRQR